jgi:uncharacterized membrane protein YcfT
MAASEASSGKLMPKRSTFTAIAAVLFTIGLVLLLAAIFRNADRGGGVLVWIALAALVGTVGCWFAAARADGA